MDFVNYEQKELRRVRRIVIGNILTRTYTVPKDSAAVFYMTTLARGTIMPGEPDALTSPRVKNIRYDKPNSRGNIIFVIDWIQPVAYA